MVFSPFTDSKPAIRGGRGGTMAILGTPFILAALIKKDDPAEPIEICAKKFLF
jgi:hypothetical protein